jgi:hypothetical protein
MMRVFFIYKSTLKLNSTSQEKVGIDRPATTTTTTKIP